MLAYALSMGGAGQTAEETVGENGARNEAIFRRHVSHAERQHVDGFCGQVNLIWFFWQQFISQGIFLGGAIFFKCEQTYWTDGCWSRRRRRFP